MSAEDERVMQADCKRCHGRGGRWDPYTDQWYTCFDCVAPEDIEAPATCGPVDVDADGREVAV